jgi:hypothetical protein
MILKKMKNSRSIRRFKIQKTSKLSSKLSFLEKVNLKQILFSSKINK